MRLGYNTNGLQNHRLEDALRLLADHGYGAVAITPDVMHLDPATVTAKEVARVAQLLDRLDLHPIVETGARFLLDPSHKHRPTLMDPDPAAVGVRLDFYRRVAAIGRDLGAGVVSFWAGTDPEPGPDSDARLRDGVARAAEAIAAAGLTPALEPEPGMAVATLGDWRQLRKQLPGPGVALALDVGHLWVEWEGDPYRLIRGCGPELVQVHLEDMRRGQHVHLAPGEGEVDFPRVRQALLDAGYRGAVCFELSRDSHRAPELVRRCADTWGRD